MLTVPTDRPARRVGRGGRLVAGPGDGWTEEEGTVARFVVRDRERAVSGRPQYLVVDTEDRHRPVAEFDDRDAAEAHAQRLAEGPFDWDEQDAWHDEWDDWGEPEADDTDG